MKKVTFNRETKHLQIVLKKMWSISTLLGIPPQVCINN